MSDRDERSQLLPQDEYSITLADKRRNPEHVESSGEVELQDFYGNAETWVIKTLRVHNEQTVFLLRIGANQSLRIVLPPQVTAAIARQRVAIGDKVRRRGARKAAATREALGIQPGFLKGKPKQTKDETGPCSECGNEIRIGAPLVNTDHTAACSLHPDNVGSETGGGVVRVVHSARRPSPLRRRKASK